MFPIMMTNFLSLSGNENRVYGMLQKGIKKSIISKKLGVDRKTVYNLSVRMENEIDFKNRKQKGGIPRLTPEQKKLKKLLTMAPVNMDSMLIYGH